MKKTIFLVMLFCFVFTAGACFAETVFKLNGKDIERGEITTFFKSDLSANKLAFSVPVSADAVSLEISVDNGRTWNAMDKEGNNFVFRYRPSDQEKMEVVFMEKNKSGMTKTKSTNVTLYFSKESPEEGITLLFDKMKSSYEIENKGRFLAFISSRFPDRVKFEESIQNDFYQYKNIRLFYKIEKTVVEPDQKSAISDVYWEKRFQNRDGASFTEKGTISMKLSKEGSGWIVDSMRNNNIFGSSLLALGDLTIQSSDITSGYVGPNYTVNAVIHNIGQAAVSNFKVRFEMTTGGTTPGTETVMATVNSNSQVTVSHSFGAIVPVPGDVITVIIDPDNQVLEENENNNRATKTL